MTVRKLTPAKPENSAKTGHLEAKTETAKVAAPMADRPKTIRSICEEGLLAGLPYSEIIAKVKALHPTASTSQACVAWYRTKMVRKGLLPSGKELAAQRRRALAEADHAGK